MIRVPKRAVVATVALAVPLALAVPAIAGPGGGSSSSLPKITFSSANYSVNEAGGIAVITLKRTAPSKSASSTVNFLTTDGSAIAPGDYADADATVTFTAKQTTATVNVPIVNDTDLEGSETVNLTLGSTVTGAQLGTQKTATLTIVDSEVAGLAVNNPAAVTEGSPIVFTVTLSPAAPFPVSVNWAASSGTAVAPGDFPSGQSGPISFAPGETSKTFSVNTTDDLAEEVDGETVNVTLSSPSAGSQLSDGSGFGLINDNCTEDAFENNDTNGTASPYTVPLNARTCSGDSDYYSFSATAGDAIDVAATFSHAEGDIDIVLRDPSASTMASSIGVVDNEHIAMTAPTTGTYTVQAYQCCGDTGTVEGNGYGLTIQTAAPPTIVVSDNPTVAETGSLVYTLTLSAPTFVDVTGTVQTWGSNTPDGRYTAVPSAPYTIPAGATFTTFTVPTTDDTTKQSPTTVWSRILSATNATIPTFVCDPYYPDYSCGENNTDDAWGNGTLTSSCTDDGYEDNDSPATAGAITPGTPLNANVCGTDPDYYAFTVTAGEQIDVGATFTHAEGDVDIFLYDPSGSQVDQSVGTGNSEAITHVAAATGTYKVRVILFNGVDNGTVEGSPYTLSVDLS